MECIVCIEWKGGMPSGAIEAANAKLQPARITKGSGKATPHEFAFSSDGPCRLELALNVPHLDPGPRAALVTVRTRDNPFSFFVRDVTTNSPVFIPACNAAVVSAQDDRSYNQIEEDVRGKGLQTKLERIESEPEESYEAAAGHTRRLRGPVWLGLSRDMRIFAVSLPQAAQRWYSITPQFHGAGVSLPENDDKPLSHNFFLGRGIGCVDDVTRRLEDGILPILHARIVDEDVRYDCTTFVTLESQKLTAPTLRGTHFLVADGCGSGHMLTEKQEQLRQSLLPAEMNRDEETVLWFQAAAVNRAAVPRYAWFKTVAPALPRGGGKKTSFDPKTGFATYDSGRVFCLSKLNGKPMPQEEVAVLLQPGEGCTFQFVLPHRPISSERALSLRTQAFAARHAECRAFWRSKLDAAARVSLPEERINEMVQAGLLHLDLVAYGLEPKGPVAATIGVYCPIGSESAPIIQFMDCMGWHDLAERSLAYFLEKQHDDGFMQNFGGYMLETGAALWSMGEHYRYTRNEAWVRRIAPNLLSACRCILAWRQRNQTDALRGRGYGLLDGKVADPEDPYHVFMLNGYAYLGLTRVAEMIAHLDPAESAELDAEAQTLKRDIRAALLQGAAKSPVVPLGDGTWCPTIPPWAEYRGPTALQADGGNWFTHGSVACRDSLTGPLYLIFQEIVAPDEPVADFMVNANAELFCERNVAFAQPYYSRHDFAHLKRGEVKAFLKTFYNTFASLADRETYSFWEHYFHASPHKTHEEAWFLMQTRWMLYMEDADTLRLLPAIPRAWLQNGKRIELNNVASYFGPLSLRVESNLDHARIEATVECRTDRQPKSVELRLPHPLGKKAVAVAGAGYDPERELVTIPRFKDKAAVTLTF